VKGFSVLQRLELWGAALKVFRVHPWIGVGTGDVNDELHAQLKVQQSEIAGSGQSVHNQYLTFLVAFGVIGCALLLFMFGRAIPALGSQPTILIAWLLVILISCVSENTLGTLAGILFCSWFLAFRK
jgi:O-antigen ligase